MFSLVFRDVSLFAMRIRFASVSFGFRPRFCAPGLAFPGNHSGSLAIVRRSCWMDCFVGWPPPALGSCSAICPSDKPSPHFPAHAEQSASLGERHCVPTCLRSLLCLAPDPGWPRQEMVRRKVRKSPKIEIDTTDKRIRRLTVVSFRGAPKFSQVHHSRTRQNGLASAWSAAILGLRRVNDTGPSAA